MKNCRVCLIPFDPKAANQTFCSDVCRGVYYGRSPESIRKRLEGVKNRVTEWRRALKMKAVEYKGGHCEVCRYNTCFDALEFHHLDPSQKDFGVSLKGQTRSWKRVKEEIDKCALLCCRCHREVHAGIITLACRTIGSPPHC